MKTELEQLLAVVDKVRSEVHPHLPQDLLRRIILIEEETGRDVGESIARIRSLIRESLSDSGVAD